MSSLDEDHLISLLRESIPKTTLDGATRAVYHRAIDDPSSVTDDERRRITNRPPQVGEDAFCRRKCGYNMSELVAKAAQQDSPLSYVEAQILAYGIDKDRYLKVAEFRRRLTSNEDRELCYSAVDAAQTQEMSTAQKVAHQVVDRVQDEKTTARKFFSTFDGKNLKYSLGIKWQSFLLDAKLDAFGLVAFFRNRNGDPRWPDFQGKVDSGVYHGLRYNYLCTTEATIAKFTIHWVEYEDESQLQSHFETMREAGQFPSGLRTDGFLYVDDACIQSVDSVRPFICYWEPHTSRQPLKVDIKHICPGLFARLTQRDMPTDKERT